MSEPTKLTVDFIGIGAPRCGTTWLSVCLGQHPEICFSKEKETHFFDLPYNHDRGLAYYASFFAAAEMGQKVGEFTPAYYLHPHIASEINELFPEVKLIVVLRDPVQRFISDVNYNARRTGTEHDVDALISAADTRFIYAGYYAKHLTTFLQDIPTERVQVAWYDDIENQPHELLKDVYTFLDVDSSFVPPSVAKAHNTGSSAGFRFPVLYRLINLRKQLKRSWIGFRLIQLLKLLGLNRVTKWMLNKSAKPESDISIVVTKAQQQQLYQLYKDDIRALEDMFKVRLDSWHQYDS